MKMGVSPVPRHDDWQTQLNLLCPLIISPSKPLVYIARPVEALPLRDTWTWGDHYKWAPLLTLVELRGLFLRLIQAQRMRELDLAERLGPTICKTLP